MSLLTFYCINLISKLKSAGVGRTGAFILVHCLLNLLFQGISEVNQQILYMLPNYLRIDKLDCLSG